MEISVLLPAGEEFHTPVDPSSTVKEFKKLILEKAHSDFGLEDEEFFFINESDFPLDQTLADCGIQEGDTLYCITRDEHDSRYRVYNEFNDLKIESLKDIEKLVALMDNVFQSSTIADTHASALQSIMQAFLADIPVKTIDLLTKKVRIRIKSETPI